MIKLKPLLLENVKNKLVVYQGRSVYNKKSKFFTTDKEFARNFTQSGQDHEIVVAEINSKMIYKQNPLPMASSENEFDECMSIAKNKGYSAFWLNEGQRQPPSIFVFNMAALKIIKPSSIKESNTKNKIVKTENDDFKPKLVFEITDVEREEMYPEDSDKWDDWVEYLDHFDYDCPRIELSKLKTRFDLEYIAYFEQKIIKLYDNKKRSVWLEYDKENETFDVIKDIMDWLYSNDAETVTNLNSDDIYSNYLETTLKKFKENPSPVYHYTTEENWELIRQDGKLVGSSGTGINNRNAHGIFTSIDPEEYQDGTYGNICLELNLPAFKSKFKIPNLDIYYEPQVADHMIREYIAYKLELGELLDDYHSEGISPYTLIVGHTIPLEFIKQI